MDQYGAFRYSGISAVPEERQFNYDGENRLIRLEIGSEVSYYSYDPSGERISSSESGGTTWFFFAGYEVRVEGTTTTVTAGYFANNMRIAQRKTVYENSVLSSEELLYIHTDHLGSAVRMTDESGNVVSSLAYSPFGETIYAAGDEETPYQFTGQHNDGNGIYYFHARYYDPVLGRFLQADSVLDGLNRYAYCGNNPVVYTDPSGLYTGPEFDDTDYNEGSITGDYFDNNGSNYDSDGWGVDFWESHLDDNGNLVWEYVAWERPVNVDNSQNGSGGSEVGYGYVTNSGVGDTDDEDEENRRERAARATRPYFPDYHIDATPVYIDNMFIGYRGDARTQERLLAIKEHQRIDAGDIGDFASNISLAMDVAGVYSLFVAPQFAPAFFIVSTSLDVLATGAYLVDGDVTSAVFSITSGALGFGLPAPKFNAKAYRFYMQGVGRFMKFKIARSIYLKESLISPTSYGLDLYADKLLGQ